MSGGYLGEAGRLIIETILGLYLLCILLRFMFQLFRADFRNPISQFLVSITNPPLKLLRRIIPGFGGIDIASLVLAFVVAALKLYLIAIIFGGMPHPAGVAILAVAEILKMLVYIILIAIIIRIVLSWIQPQGSHNPMMSLLYSVTEPVMAPARRIIPSIGGLDLSPILVLLVLQVVLILLVAPLADFGASMLRSAS